MRTELVEKASEVIEDTTILINMVSKRVRQLNNGRSPLITVVERLGAADIALTEIIEGKIVIDESEGDDVREAE
jgi:DNA-directed RNA polymerase subunit omega